MKKQQGITLIALVVTIVVLLILASIGISVLVDNGRIKKQKKEDKKQTEIAEEKEVLTRTSAQAAGKDV